MSKIKRFVSLFSPHSIQFIQPYWKKEQWAILLGFFNRTKYSQAPRLLENAIMKQDGEIFCRSLNLGRSAIQIALESFQFPPEAEVILPSFSCAGVITPVIFAGLQPVLVDIDDHFNIAAASVRQAISSKTRAIILPHLSGKLAGDFFELLDIANKTSIKVIVDATQALGLKVDDRSIGTFGNACIYSFNGGKIIPGSGGGLLVSDDEEVISHIKCRKIPLPRDERGNIRIFHYFLKHGLHKISHPFYGIRDAVNHRFANRPSQNPDMWKNHAYPVEDMDSIESALALSQLKYLPEIIANRRQNAERLIVSDVLQNLGFRIPDSKNHLFTKFLVTHANAQVSMKVRNTLHEHGIETEQFYTPLNLRDIGKTARKVDTPNTDRFWKGAFAIPVNPWLGPQDMERIIHALKKTVL